MSIFQPDSKSYLFLIPSLTHTRMQMHTQAHTISLEIPT